MDDAALSPPVRADLEAARARIAGHARRTPLLGAPLLDRIAGRPVRVKAECLQLTGSFKFRGAFNALAQLPPGEGVIAFSSGNHAQGVAHAAALQGRAAVIVMPHDAPAVKVERTAAYGAEVVRYRRGREDRAEVGARLAAERGLHLVRPYDDARVIAGQGTCGLEIAEDMPADTGEVIVCCGGGGLTAGVALALEGTGAAVRPAEPEGFDDVARSLEAGRIVANAGPEAGLCDAILTPAPGEVTFPVLRRLCGPGHVVTDEEALRPMALAWAHLRIVLEPGGAVALAAALFRPGPPCVAVASGGNVDAAVFARALATL